MNRLLKILSGSFIIITGIANFSIDGVSAEQLPVMSRIIVREGTVIVSKDSMNRLTYSLIDNNNNKIENNVLEVQFAAKYPSIYDRLRPAVANAKNTPYSGILFW